MAKALIIGSGGIAGRHAAMLQKTPSVTLVGAVDVRTEQAQAFAARHRIPAYTDLRKALDECAPAYAVVATPRTAREEILATLAERQIPALIEKPPCDRLSTGRRILAILNASKLIHSVGFMHRYNPAVDTVRRKIAGHKISLIHITIRTPLAYMDLWKTKPYPYNVERSGGIVGEVGIHYIDLVRFLCGGEMTRVSGLGTVQVLQPDANVTTYDAAGWVMQMDNNVLATVSQTWASHGWRATIEVLTDKGSAVCQVMGGPSLAWGDMDGVPFRIEAEEDAEHMALHASFLDAVTRRDMSPVRSPFADALATFETGAKINQHLYGTTTELE
jgi:predicted dehydrogenase